MRYGMPYRGSKNQIAKWVIENLPKKENLYDLFGGGGAITHCACESGKYTQIYYNDCNQLVVKAFDMAIHGKFRNENRWISHDEFMEKRKIDPYVAICFSFGNNLKNYCYSKEKEPYKKALHYAICFDDFSLLENLGVKLKRKSSGRIELTKQVKELLKLNKLEVQSLESLERLQSLDYRRVRIKNNSVIYCDPPYKDTAKYTVNFNHNEFYKWCKKQKQLTIISEYQMPQDFICIAQKEKRVILSDNSLLKTEKLFVPKHQYQMYLDAMAVLK